MSVGKVIALIVGLGVGAGVLMIVICGGLFYAGYRNADANASPKVDALFDAFAANDLASTYANETTDEFKKVMSEDQFAGVAETFTTRLGKLKSKSMRGYVMKQRNGASYIEVTYSATFEKGTGTILATLKDDNGDWKFEGFRVNSPVFDLDLALHRCPACNESHPESAKFCPDCGAALANRAGKVDSQPTEHSVN